MIKSTVISSKHTISQATESTHLTMSEASHAISSFDHGQVSSTSGQTFSLSVTADVQPGNELKSVASKCTGATWGNATDYLSLRKKKEEDRHLQVDSATVSPRSLAVTSIQKRRIELHGQEENWSDASEANSPISSHEAALVESHIFSSTTVPTPDGIYMNTNAIRRRSMSSSPPPPPPPPIPQPSKANIISEDRKNTLVHPRRTCNSENNEKKRFKDRALPSSKLASCPYDVNTRAVFERLNHCFVLTGEKRRSSLAGIIDPPPIPSTNVRLTAEINEVDNMKRNALTEPLIYDTGTDVSTRKATISSTMLQAAIHGMRAVSLMEVNGRGELISRNGVSRFTKSNIPEPSVNNEHATLTNDSSMVDNRSRKVDRSIR